MDYAPTMATLIMDKLTVHFGIECRIKFLDDYQISGRTLNHFRNCPRSSCNVSSVYAKLLLPPNQPLHVNTIKRKSHFYLILWKPSVRRKIQTDIREGEAEEEGEGD